VVVIAIWLVLIVSLALLWAREIGYYRAFVAAGFRAAWTLPIVLSLFPLTVTRRIPGAVATQPIHILVDDSDSMDQEDAVDETASKQVSNLLKRIEDVCSQFGCLPKITKLSDMAPDTHRGFTPLSRVLESWLYKTAGDPWMVLSDGGDFRPMSSWEQNLEGRGENNRVLKKEVTDTVASPKKTLGLVVAFGKPRAPGFSVQGLTMAPLAFEGKAVQVSVDIARLNPKAEQAERVQIQVALDGKVLTASEAIFSPGAPVSSVDISFAAPKRGPHIVTARVLPVAGELDTWDNSQTRVLDVMPNTVGVLHLLGSPAWDGRFMRRFLKAEPKFDVISFFILRDPWDTQHVSEREMSLIPFPVERLFKEELVNFRVIVMQNFTLMRFLQPEYQENLAKFVKDGGGLLFVGGPRALTETDVSSSALAGLLPFTIDSGGRPPKAQSNPPDEFNDGFGSMGSTWDADQKFSIEVANPDANRRSLATIYENWLELSPRLALLRDMSGIHDMEIFKFRNDETTSLLDAKLPDGRKMPLAMASYPGKGRALWLFSDSLWRLAMSPDARLARSDYHAFMDGALNWLTKGDMKGALSVRDFIVSPIGDHSDRLKWSAVFAGSAARYLRSANAAKLNVCGVGVNSSEVSFGGVSGDAVTMEGELGASLRNGSLCSLKFEAEHPAFGSLSVTGWSVIPETLPDQGIGPSPMKLKALAKITGADFVDATEERARTVEAWVQGWGAFDGSVLPDKTQTRLDYYWPQAAPWIWIALLLLPFEVLTRRWHLIFGGWSASRREAGS
jgi:hypothetical protein